MLIRKPDGVPIREGTTAASQPPLAATPRGDSFARERAPVGDSLNDE